MLRPIAAPVTVLLVTVLLAMGACRSPGPATGDDPAVSPYADFAVCAPVSGSTEHAPIEGLVVPTGMIITDVNETGPVINVTGLIDRTPLEIRADFEGRDDVTLISAEDEVYEAEILVAAQGHRTFIKATIRCRTGSTVGLVLAPAPDEPA